MTNCDKCVALSQKKKNKNKKKTSSERKKLSTESGMTYTDDDTPGTSTPKIARGRGVPSFVQPSCINFGKGFQQQYINIRLENWRSWPVHFTSQCGQTILWTPEPLQFTRRIELLLVYTQSTGTVISRQ